jgi:hypothetical protein
MKVAAVEVDLGGRVRVVLTEAGAVAPSGNPLDEEFGCDGRH